MQRTLIFIFILQICFQDSQNQIITLNSYNHNESLTACLNDLVINDKFVFRGQINATGTLQSDWPLYILFVKRQLSQSFTKLCEVDIITYGCGTSLKERLPCYCESRTGDIYNYVLNETAILSLSKNEIQGQWTRSDSNDATATSLEQLPTIYDAVIYTVNGTKETSLALNYKLDNIFEYCIQNLKDPSLQIDWEGNTIGNSMNGCATAVINPQELTSSTLSLKYVENSGCGRKGNFTILINVINSQTDISSTTTPSPTTTLANATTVKDASKTDGLSGPEKLGLIIGVIIGALIIFAIILIVICIRCKRCCRCCEEAFGCEKVSVKMKCCTTDVTCSLFCCCVKGKKKEAHPRSVTAVTQPEHTTLPLKESQRNTEATLIAVNKHVVSSRPLPPLQTLHIPPTRISPEAIENNETPKKKRGKKKKSKKNTTEIV